MKSTLRVQLGLLVELVVYAYRTRYGRSALGVAWLFLHPLLLMAVYGLVFSQLVSLRPGSMAADAGYAFYLAAGFLPWLALQEILVGSTRTFRENAQFLTRLPAAPEASSAASRM